MVNCRTGKRVSLTGTACSFCDCSANVLSVSYTVRICFVRYTSVTSASVDRSLSVCLVRMRSLRLPLRSSPHLRRLPSRDKQFFADFLSVRRPLPLSIYMCQHNKSCHELIHPNFKLA